MAVVGVDACRGGWFAVRREGDDTISFEVFGTNRELWEARGAASTILIDIPIGLID
jgi:predicted RNase H-like nuclease